MRPASLRRTLFRNTLALVSLIVVLTGALAFWTARQEIDRLYDQQLVIGAEVLRSLMQEELGRGPARAGKSLEVTDKLLSGEDKRAFNAYAEWRMFRVWRRDSLALASDTGPHEPGPPPRPGFRWLREGEKQWRIFTLISSGEGVVIELGERRGIRELLVNAIAVDLIGPLLLLIPASLALIWFSISAALNGLGRLVGELSMRSETNFTPLSVLAWPVELTRLVSGVNRLLSRLEQAFQRERRFTDHAAHQLRTPLAALKLQAQVARRETDPGRSRLALESMEAATDRAAQLVEQLLTLARLEEGLHASSASDLQAEAAAALADAASFASSRQVSLALLAPSSAPISADPVRVRLILDNLLGNAIKHSPPGAEVSVEVSAAGKDWLCCIVDAGPGLSEADLQHAFEPFQTGESPQSGFGLGLAIVAEAVRTCGGQVGLATVGPSGGCRASVSFTGG